MKKCAKCGELLPDGAFYVDQRAYDGLSSYCKECKRIARKLHYKHNPQTGSGWDKKHPERAKERKMKYKEKWRNQCQKKKSMT